MTGVSKREREQERRAARLGAELVPVYVTNATRTSRGTGPGVLRLPREEAGALVRDRLAVYGKTAPQDTRAARTGLRS